MDFLLPRCLLVWLAVTGATTTLARSSLVDVRALTSATSFDSLVTSLAGLALLGCALWAWAVTTVVVAGAVGHRGRSGDPGDGYGVPRWARRMVLAACGIALVGAAPVVPAQATPGVISPVAQEAEQDPRSGPLTDLPLPDRTHGPLRDLDRGPAASRDPEGAAATSTGATSVTVRPGDSLWSIATDLLPPGAADQQIAALVADLYAANRALIGADPDLIQPAHRLRTPLGERPAR